MKHVKSIAYKRLPLTMVALIGTLFLSVVVTAQENVDSSSSDVEVDEMPIPKGGPVTLSDDFILSILSEDSDNTKDFQNPRPKPISKDVAEPDQLIEEDSSSSGELEHSGRPAGQSGIPRPRGGKIVPMPDAMLKQLQDNDTSYNGRPVGQPQPRPRGYVVSLPSTYFNNKNGELEHSGRPAGQPGIPRPRNGYVIPFPKELISNHKSAVENASEKNEDSKPRIPIQPLPDFIIFIPDDLGS